MPTLKIEVIWYAQRKLPLENRDINSSPARMLSERSSIWANPLANGPQGKDVTRGCTSRKDRSLWRVILSATHFVNTSLEALKKITWIAQVVRVWCKQCQDGGFFPRSGQKKTCRRLTSIHSHASSFGEPGPSIKLWYSSNRSALQQ